jgi:hypothetical protein
MVPSGTQNQNRKIETTNMNPNPSRTPTTTGTSARPAGAQTTQNPWLYGTIRSVEPSREMLLLHLPDINSEEIIHWLPHTRFIYHGDLVRPDALSDGQQISVQFSSDGGQKFATEIDIVVKPPVRESIAAERQSLWPSRAGKSRRSMP